MEIYAKKRIIFALKKDKNYIIILIFAIIFTSSCAKKMPSAPAAPGYQSEEEVQDAIKTGEVKLMNPMMPLVMPEGVEQVKDIEYKNVDGHSLTLDIYKPVEIKKNAPLLVFIHGGGWKGGNKSVYRFYATRYAQKGYVAASISYRLSGEAAFPAAVEDAICAVKYLRANADKYGIDPNNICVLGGSAGGHLAMMAGYCSEKKWSGDEDCYPEVSSRVQGVVNLYGPCDLTTPIAQNSGMVYEFLGKRTYEESPDIYRQSSPIFYVTQDDPPTLILHGSLDSLVPINQSDRLAEALKKAGVKCTYDRLEGWPHTMDLAEMVFNRCVFFIDMFLAENMPVPEPGYSRVQ